MILPIITMKDNNSVLHTRGRDVDDVRAPDIQELIDDMIPTMYEKDGIGLAAPQVNKGVRIAVLCPDPQNFEQYSEKKDTALIIINPKIIGHSFFKAESEEGCLSVPEIFGLVKRWKGVTVSYLDREGKKQTIKASGLLAVCLQHEIDHLDGILFIDRTKKVYRVPKL